MRSEPGTEHIAPRLREFAIVAAVVLAVGWWTNPRFERVFEGRDVPQYTAVAQSLDAPSARDRPLLYPLLLRTSMELLGDQWKRGIAAAQAVCLAVMACLVLDVLRRLRVGPVWACATAIVGCVTPELLLISYEILPDVVLGLLMVWAWREAALLVLPPPAGTARPVRTALVCGLASGLAALLKPVWLLGAIPLAAGVAAVRWRRYPRAWAAASLIIAVHVALVLPWQLFLIRRFGQYSFTRLKTHNFNLAAIRMGFTADAAGTPLYDYLGRAGLLPSALSLKWEDYDEFTRIKDGIPWEERMDRAFEKSVTKKDGVAFARVQLIRSPRFFSVRPPSFAFMPGELRRICDGVYARLFRLDAGSWRIPILFILVLIGFVRLLWERETRGFGVVTLFVVVYYWGIVFPLTYQDPHFTRLRAPLEPILFCVAMLPAGLWLSRRARERSERVNPPGEAASPRAASG